MVRWIRWPVIVLLVLAAITFGLFWLFLHATPGQYRGVFNFIYSHPMGSFSRQPNRLLSETITSLTPGRALDVAMGEGRNAIYLASKGWDVTGFDVSDEALRQAAARAAAAGVRIQIVRQSSEAFDYGHERWDLVLFSYAFAPIRDPAYIRRIRDSLRPGGVVVFEHYIGLPGVLEAPGAAAPGELPRLFADFEIRRHEVTKAKSDWQFGRTAPLARLVAVKRGS